jgi:hypothetical protein
MTTLSIDTPETQEAVERWRQGKINIFDEMAKLERERDEARKALEEEKKWHHRTHTELVHTQCKILDMQMGRDKMQTELEMWRDGNILHEVHRDELEKTERERDEARSALADVEEYGTEEINAAVELRQRLATALVERDEAREALKIKQ